MLARFLSSFAICLVVLAVLVWACRAEQDESEGVDERVVIDHAAMREQMLAHVREVAAWGPWVPCALPSIAGPLHVTVSLYVGGQRVGQSFSAGDELCAALTEATQKTVAASELDRSQLAQARFAVELIDRDFGLIEHEDQAVELVGDVVPVRSLDKAMLRARIDEGKAYLLRVLDPALGGAHKYYYAQTDSFEDRLHTIYTASTVYTLLAIYEHDRDEALREPIERAAGFLLSMQRVAPDQPAHGAFHYSLARSQRVREPRFVVGTTAKTIFTLIELHELTGEPRYMAAAQLGAQWLMSMQREDGRVAPELHVNGDGEWVELERESMLYTGQVLSALSRLYAATGEPRYLEAASRTADHVRATIDREGCYLGDDYRSRNPISSSWAILSLFDFARASGDAGARERVYACADALLERQIDSPGDVHRHGRWSASLSSSGSGWLAEVLSTIYLDCSKDDAQGCGRYRDAVVALFRLLMQHTYGPENSFVTRNPDMARGGLFWNARDRYVRTDSVCHALNAYVFMLDALPEGVLVELPQLPLNSSIQPE